MIVGGFALDKQEVLEEESMTIAGVILFMPFEMLK